MCACGTHPTHKSRNHRPTVGCVAQATHAFGGWNGLCRLRWLPRHNQWQNQACLAVREDIQTLHLLATEKWLTSDGNAEARAGLESILEKAGQQISAMQAYEQTDLAMLSALARSLLRLLA